MFEFVLERRQQQQIAQEIAWTRSLSVKSQSRKAPHLSGSVVSGPELMHMTRNNTTRGQRNEAWTSQKDNNRHVFSGGTAVKNKQVKPSSGAGLLQHSPHLELLAKIVI